MKCIVLLATFACVLSASLAFKSHKVQKAHSEVMSYVQKSMGNVRMMRGSASHLMCYDDFIPLINRIAEGSKTNSQHCVIEADGLKANQTSNLTKQRSILAAQVKRIQDSLTNCSKNEDGLGYFQCLLGLVDEDKKILDTIAATSSSLVSQYNDMIRQIDGEEQVCLRQSVDSAKAKSDQAFEGLKYCLANGPQKMIEPEVVETQDNNDTQNVNESEDMYPTEEQ